MPDPEQSPVRTTCLNTRAQPRPDAPGSLLSPSCPGHFPWHLPGMFIHYAQLLDQGGTGGDEQGLQE